MQPFLLLSALAAAVSGALGFRVIAGFLETGWPYTTTAIAAVACGLVAILARPRRDTADIGPERPASQIAYFLELKREWNAKIDAALAAKIENMTHRSSGATTLEIGSMFSRNTGMYDVALVGAAPSGDRAVRFAAGIAHCGGHRIGDKSRPLGSENSFQDPRSFSIAPRSARSCTAPRPFRLPEKRTFDTASISRIGHHWGQQFSVMQKTISPGLVNAPITRSYKHACAVIEALFTCSPGTLPGRRDRALRRIRTAPADLLVSTANGRLNLLAMRNTSLDWSQLHNAHLIPLAAVAWEKEGMYLRVRLAETELPS